MCKGYLEFDHYKSPEKCVINENLHDTNTSLNSYNFKALETE